MTQVEVHERSIVIPACFPPATYLFGDICVQANKMRGGTLYKAAANGNLEASVAAIRSIGQLLTVSHTPSRHDYHTHPSQQPPHSFITMYCTRTTQRLISVIHITQIAATIHSPHSFAHDPPHHL